MEGKIFIAINLFPSIAEKKNSYLVAQDSPFHKRTEAAHFRFSALFSVNPLETSVKIRIFYIQRCEKISFKDIVNDGA